MSPIGETYQYFPNLKVLHTFKLVENQVMCYSRVSLEIDGTLNVAHVLVPIKYNLLDFEVYLQSSKSVLWQKMHVFEQLKSPLLVNSKKKVWPLKVLKCSVHIFRGF